MGYLVFTSQASHSRTIIDLFRKLLQSKVDKSYRPFHVATNDSFFVEKNPLICKLPTKLNMTRFFKERFVLDRLYHN